DAGAVGGIWLGGGEARVGGAGWGGGGGGGLLGAGFGVGVAADLPRGGQAVGFAVPADFDAGQVEGVEDTLDGAPGQRRVGLIDAAEQFDGGVLADLAVFGPQERLRELRRGRGRVGGAGQPPLDRRVAGRLGSLPWVGRCY